MSEKQNTTKKKYIVRQTFDGHVRESALMSYKSAKRFYKSLYSRYKDTRVLMILRRV